MDSRYLVALSVSRVSSRVTGMLMFYRLFLRYSLIFRASMVSQVACAIAFSFKPGVLFVFKEL